jgi:hypothetical protein
MSWKNSILSIAVLMFVSVGCSTSSPVSPSATNDAPPISASPSAPGRTSVALSTPANAAPGVAGSYELSFFSDGQEVTTLRVCQPSTCPELDLRAHVEGNSGPAQRGSVTFQYCSYRGGPPNDLSRPDEAPSSACEIDGTGRWTSLLSLKIDASGNAAMTFGYVSIPRTIGFRIRYSPQGGGIASGASLAEDFTWTAQ